MMLLFVSFLLCMGSFVSGDLTLGLKEDANTVITSSSCIEKERQALLSFKASLVDIHNNLYDWGSREEQRDCCKWVGVRCNNHTRHVIGLDLSNSHSLAGIITPSLPFLHQLEYLDLSGIDFQFNPLPTFLGSLTNLRRLDISAANLSGHIPHQLANLSNLLHLDLRHNFLEGSIPFPFRDLTSLTYLDLSKNHLKGSLPNFFGWSSLSKLSLAHNSFNGSIPDFIGCPTLRELDLSSNRLSGNLPKSVGQLSNLEYLDVSSNSLKGVISDVHFLNLTHLMYLDLSLNLFTFEMSSHGKIPSQLDTIKLQSCKLGPTFPVWIQDQKEFTHLDISGARISDIIPVWFWDLPLGLKFLNLSSNEMTGTLPDLVFDFDGYPGVDLSYNHFQGKVPLLPSKLSALILSGNKFSGTLSFLCQIESTLSFLDLSNNMLSGELPNCWSKFQRRLVVLNLSNNNLSGEVPSSLGFLSRLEALYLRANAFVGEFPIFLSNCTSLRFVDLGENKLSGIIPAWIGERLSNLSFLVLRSNRFYGSLSSQMCLLNNLQLLDLSKNGISGNIPRCYGNFTAMTSRKVDNITNHSYSSYARTTLWPQWPKEGMQYPQNHNHGSNATICTPRGGGSHCMFSKDHELAFFYENALVVWKGAEREFGRGLKLVKSIDLSDNKLSGKLPYEITSLHGLVSLNLSTNKLQGEVPKQMGLLKSLEILDLSRNEFSENIPSSLSEISFLSYLDLSNNNFLGRIPTGPQLQLFDCSSYSGNPHLYGPPLTSAGCGLPPAIVVRKEHNEKEEEEEDGDELWNSYYMGMGVGFGVGFWGICATIFLNRSCRYFLFVSLTHIKDWIYVTTILHFLKLKRKFER